MNFVDMLGMEVHTRRASVYLLVGEVEGVGIEILDLSLVYMHKLHPSAKIHTGCKFAPGVYFGHINGIL